MFLTGNTMGAAFPAHRGTYRKDIDGLRAIAVLSVIINHLNPSILPGGYTGVDIFFVISGYVITLRIFKEIDNNNFSILDFYKRRVNRILPALILVLMASLILGLFILSPTDLVTLSKSVLSSVFGLSNIFFWRNYGNYFGGDTSEAILLHTWSLGVEEQFYVVWPATLIVISAIAYRLGNRSINVIAVAVLICFGIAMSEFGVRNFLSASYYLLPARLFELTIGGLAAILAYYRFLLPQWTAKYAYFIGFGLIVSGLVLLNSESAFPGLNALLPCVGTAATIAAGESGLVFSPLAGRIPVLIGKISYSLYLWHWPIIAYLHYCDVDIGVYIGVAVVIASVALAWGSWKYVEVPFRANGARSPFQDVLIWRFVAPATMFVIIGMAIVVLQGLPERFNTRVAALEQDLAQEPDQLRRGCHVPTALYRTPPNPNCRLGAEKTTLDGLMIGDSFANHFTGMIDIIAKHDNLAIRDYTMDGCPPILEYQSNKLSSYSEKCKVRIESDIDMIRNGHFKYVVLGASWPAEPGVEDMIARTIEAILGSGSKPIIILANQVIPKGYACPIRNEMYGRVRDCTAAQSERNPYLDAIIHRFPSVRVIDPNEVICENRACSPVVDGVLLYRDDVHLNDAGSRLIGRKLVGMGRSLNGGGSSFKVVAP